MLPSLERNARGLGGAGIGAAEHMWKMELVRHKLAAEKYSTRKLTDMAPRTTRSISSLMKLAGLLASR